MIKEFKFRPHHLVCNLCFRGYGYNDDFVANFKYIHATLLTNPDAKCIQLVNGVDDICLACPQNNLGTCVSASNVETIDNAYRALLQLAIGDLVSLNTVKAKVKDLLSIEHFHTICGPCAWKNICQEIVQSHIND